MRIPVYVCKNCKQMTIWGCVNEYDEHFCSKECYEKYCEKNDYEPHIEKLSFIK